MMIVMAVTKGQPILFVKMMFKCSNNINAIYDDYKNGRDKFFFIILNIKECNY